MGNSVIGSGKTEDYNNDYTSDRIASAPGLGNRGLDPRNPYVVAVRGVGDRGGGENRPVKWNRTIDIRGESPVVLNRLAEEPPGCMLENEKQRSSREGQIEAFSLRTPRRIAY